MVKFHPDNHYYESIDLFDKIEWMSASKLAGAFKKKFDGKSMAPKCSSNKKSKWYGIPPNEILGYWEAENLRSTSLGNWYHVKQEQLLIAAETTERYGTQLPIVRPTWENGWKIAQDQRLSDGVYPEHLAYIKSAGVCGQFDEIIVKEGFVYVDDHKSNKDLKKPAYVNWEGRTEKMEPPLMHLENTKLNEYGLQLSLGMYMVLRHNPQLKPGKLILNHVTFEIEGEDRFGYPIMRLENNEPILKGVEKIELPYMKREVELMLQWLKLKREKESKCIK